MLLKLETLHLSYGTQVLFDGVDLVLNPGDRLCIIGRNGAGKTTLLKVIEGLVEPDSGRRVIAAGVRCAALQQELPAAAGANVYDYVASGRAAVGAALIRYRELSEQPDTDLAELSRVQAELEAGDGWRFDNAISQVLTRLQLPADRPMLELSGGWRRRADLARALVSEPEILLLDEPTNHLDLPAIEWLEELLANYAGAVVFISHDRAFLKRVANRYAELDRGRLFQAEGDFEKYTEVRARRLEEETRQAALFDKRLAAEEVWIRQGIKARRTRNEGRVRALEALRVERAARRERDGTAQLALGEAEKSGKLVIETAALGYRLDSDGRWLVRECNLRVMRGDKIGLIGPNGSGKTTLLRLLLEELAPTTGSVRLGAKLEVAYFDQMRAALDMEASAVDNVAEGREFIEIGGQRKHIYSYLSDFLFEGERARTPIKTLSGGERNRVLLARLFSKPANLLVLDEPTNDLDAETLELLEERLVEYSGTLLLVSHDREFLDNVVTSTLVLEGEGVVAEYVGGYSDMLRQRASAAPPSAAPAKSQPTVTTAAKTATSRAARKLSYKESRRLEMLPGLIETEEASLAAAVRESHTPEFFQGQPAQIAAAMADLEKRQAALDNLYREWEALLQEGQ